MTKYDYKAYARHLIREAVAFGRGVANLSEQDIRDTFEEEFRVPPNRKPMTYEGDAPDGIKRETSR